MPDPGKSPLLAWPDAVEASWPDEGVAAHYGDPMREQRAAGESAAVVDRSNRGVVRIIGPDAIRPLITALEERHGFETDVGHLTVFGRCADCRAAAHA